MEKCKLEVYHYLDMNAEFNNSIIEVFSIKKLQKTFPEMDKFSFFEAEWRTARQRMLNLKFDKDDFQ